MQPAIRPVRSPPYGRSSSTGINHSSASCDGLRVKCGQVIAKCFERSRWPGSDRGVCVAKCNWPAALEHSGRNWVDVNIRRSGQQAFLVEHGDTLESPLPECPGAAVFAIGQPGQGFLQTLHEPAQIGQPRANFRHPASVARRTEEHNSVIGSAFAGDVTRRETVGTNGGRPRHQTNRLARAESSRKST